MTKPAILVMDDESILRLLLSKLLGNKYNVTVKENGAEGVEWLQEGNKPDLVITDQHMPGLDGYGFLKYIRSKQDFNNVPVIMLSAMEETEEKLKCLSLGANDFLTKPLNIEQLKESIENLLPNSSYNLS